MSRRIPRLTGGTASARDKLNRVIDAVNALQQLTGDGLVSVQQTASGTTLRLDVDRLQARLPKLQHSGVTRFGVAYEATPWETGEKYILLHPCDDKDGNGEDTGTSIEAYIFGNTNLAPDGINVSEDDVLAYTTATDGTAILVSPPVTATSELPAGALDDILVHDGTSWVKRSAPTQKYTYWGKKEDGSMGYDYPRAVDT